MELRVLQYFLIVAREENITRAARLLHITQPTLSRQLLQLEEELGVQLFHRGQHSIRLTEDGMLLRRRAQELVSLSEKTKRELQHAEDLPAGEIAIGCGETKSVGLLAQAMVSFRQRYPLVRFSIYSAVADDIKEHIEKGLLDMGLLAEPVELSQYAFLRLPQMEQWGVLVRKDSPLAEKDSVTKEDLRGTPLLMVQRELVRSELANWFGDCYDQLSIAATYNLIVNAAFLVEQGLGAALCFDLGTVFESLRFVPFSPALRTGTVLAWKKAQALSAAQTLFIQHLKQQLALSSGTEPNQASGAAGSASAPPVRQTLPHRAIS